jgi:hypothetical protein
MRYFVPILRLGATLPPQNQLVDKLGGTPWGLPRERWPICESCGRPEALLAQIRHHHERIDLGRSGRVLFVFQCEELDGCAGQSACLVLEGAEVLTSPTEPADPDATVLPEARVVAWKAKNDHVPPRYRRHFYDETLFADLPQLVAQPFCGTKLGGVPRWCDGPQALPAPWRFVLQLDRFHVVRTEVHDSRGTRRGPTPPELPGRHFQVCTWARFGEAGRGYVFVDTSSAVPRGSLIRQDEPAI